jgi:hypothetical protein
MGRQPALPRCPVGNELADPVFSVRVSAYHEGPVTTPVYRGYAAECLRAAQLSSVAAVRSTLLNMAQLWTELARTGPT